MITKSSDGFIVASFNANDTGTSSVNDPLTTIYASGNIGSAQGAAGYLTHVAPGNYPIEWTTTGEKRKVVAASFTVANSYNNWIADYEVGNEIEIDDDPDGDKIPNGVEAFLGSNPSAFSIEIQNLSHSGLQTTFEHSITDKPPEDLQMQYQWTTDLTNWYVCDGFDGPASGESVKSDVSVSNGYATVTLTSEALLPKLFLRLTAAKSR